MTRSRRAAAPAAEVAAAPEVQEPKPIKLTLSPQQASNAVTLIDAAVRAQGVQVAGPALELISLIQQAQQAAE